MATLDYRNRVFMLGNFSAFLNFAATFANALVRNFKANVVQKEALTPPVMLTGGVVYNKGVIAALKAIFQLEDKDIIIPAHFDKMIAFGAALLAKEQQMTVTVEKLKTAAGASHQDKNKKN